MKKWILKMKEKVNNVSDQVWLRNCKKAALLLCLFYVMFPSKVYAANPLEGTSLFQGFKNLISDATTVLLAVEALIIAVLEIATGIKYQTAEIDEKKIHKKEAKSIVIVGVLIISATALLKVVFSYF